MLNKWKTILFALIIGAAVACTAVADEPTGTPTGTPTPTVVISTPTPVASPDVQQTELDLNRQLWKSKAIQRYHFEHRWICFCPQEYVALVDISVRDGPIVGIKFAEVEDGTTKGDPDISRYYTISGLFDIIQEAIDTKAFDIDVKYDAELGYPTAVYIDYDARTADEEMGFMAANLMAEGIISVRGIRRNR